MEFIKEGSILTPAGFQAGSSYCGLKQAEGALDIVLLAGEEELSGAGVFTRNLFAAAPVTWSRALLPTDHLRAIAACSGNANACTGARGEKDTRQMAQIVAHLAGCRPVQVAIASTGLIGRPLPMCKIRAGLREAYEKLSSDAGAARNAEEAIMTTDTRAKSCAVRFECEGGVVSIGGMAKGAGMIAPNMATMLAFVTTDIEAGSADCQDLLTRCAANTFNRISVDGDTSTNDSVFLAASGRSGVTLGHPEVRKRFTDALMHVMQDLAMQIVADGEGATKLIEVKACGARDQDDALKVARSIANSLLVKCAINGGDPNWGRIVCAAGYSGAKFRPADVGLLLGRTRVLKNGLPTEQNAESELSGERVRIEIDLGAGECEATFWTCDISQKYVEINADYHT